MPLMFRAMRQDADGLPLVGPSASTLGVRPGIDIDVDHHDQVILNHKGMSVSPSWQDMPLFRIPKRLGGQGKNNTFCYKRGSLPFRQTPFALGLELLPDSPTHGVVRPRKVVPLAQFEADLAATREEWQIDEA